MSKHTPKPSRLRAPLGPIIKATVDGMSMETRANAAFIVRAVNAHDALVEALEILRDTVQCNAEETDCALKRAEAALATARGAGSEDD